MGYVPTHNDSCYKIRSYPTKCSYCNKTVIYFECSCGGKVFLTPPDKGIHGCGSPSQDDGFSNRGLQGQILLDAVKHVESHSKESPTCPMCDTAIKDSKNFKRHLKKCPMRKVWFPRDSQY